VPALFQILSIPESLANISHLGPATLSIGDYYREIQDAVEDKVDTGYNTTITDYWGRSLSYQLVNATDGGPGTYSYYQLVGHKSLIGL